MDAAAVVRELFRAFAARDRTALRPLVDPECRFWPQGTAEAVGRSEAYVGLAGIGDYLDDVDRAWEHLTVEPAELRIAGHGVVCFGAAVGRPRGGAPEVRVPVIWVFRLRGERILTGQVVRTATEASALVASGGGASA